MPQGLHHPDINSNLFQTEKITNYILIWYDYEATKSYGKLQSKNNSQKNFFNRTKKAVVFLESFFPNDYKFIPKPTTSGDYIEWKKQLVDINKICCDKCFLLMKEKNFLSPKEHKFSDVSLTKLLDFEKNKNFEHLI